LRIRTEAEDRPGVYRFLGPRGETLYVGKSIRVRTRLLSHLRSKVGKGAEMLRVAHGVTWEYVGGELEALLREFHWIRTLRPRFNVVHRRDRRYAWVRKTAESAPRLIAVRGHAPRLAAGERLLGPFPATRQLPQTLRDLARACGLRDCPAETPMTFADQLPLLPQALTPLCHRGDLGTCPAPCAGRCTETEYRSGVDAALAFLDGQHEAPLHRLQSRMRQAADSGAFETAAKLRDRKEALETLRLRLRETQRWMDDLTFIYPDPGSEDPSNARWLIFLEGRLAAILPPPAPNDPDGDQRRRDDLAQVLAAPAIAWAVAPYEDREARFLAARWFRDHPEARARAIDVTQVVEPRPHPSHP
jgi:excinuclease ABC subunit C